jgi:hypothetical protein
MKGFAVLLAAAAVTVAPTAAATPPTGVEVVTLSHGYISDGAMTHWSAPGVGGCTVDAVYGSGAPVKEGVGPGFVHNGRTEGNMPLVMEVVYINPVGAARSVEVPEPAGCPVS